MRKFFGLLAFLALANAALAASLEQDVERHIQIFNGDKGGHSSAADSFSWMGLSDTRLFDIIERRLLDEHQAARNDRNDKNRVARYIRALGFSGQPKYTVTLEQLTNDGVYQRFAVAALQDLPDYQKWNPIISNRATFNAQYTDDVNRVFNMLRSDDPRLMRVAAKRIFFGVYEPELIDLLAEKTRANYARTDVADPQFQNCIAWMVKALGKASKEKYRPLIEEIAAKSLSSAVLRHATKALQ